MTERERLVDRLAELLTRQDRMEKATRAALGGRRDILASLGFSEARADALLEPDPSTGLRGFPGEAIRAVAAKAAKVRAAIEQLDRYPAGVIRIAEDRITRQVQIFLPRKCREEPRLEAAGFAWAPAREVWQRPISNGARAAAAAIAGNA